MSIDPTGRLIVLVRDGASVAAITPRVRGGEKLAGWKPPYVVIRRLTSVPWIGDPGTEGAGVQTIRYTALNYALKVENGEELAFMLAGAVADVVDNLGLLTFPLSAGRAALYRVQVDGIGPALRDPLTEEPYVPVQFTALASAQVLAPVTP